MTKKKEKTLKSQITQEDRECAMSVARQALDVMHKRKWCTGEYEAQDGKVCLMGAINTVLKKDVDRSSEHLPSHLKFAFASVLKSKYGEDYIQPGIDDKRIPRPNIEKFNDDSGSPSRPYSLLRKVAEGKF